MKTASALARLALIIPAAVACSPVSQSPAQPSIHTPTATVLRAVDGDTVDVRDDIRGRLRVRILGIDSPELHKPGWSVGCYAPEAADFAGRNLTGRRVALAPDPGQDTNDKYGRTLAYIIRDDGWNYSVEAVRAGMARPYVYGRKPLSLSPEINAAEAQAKTERAGLWGPECNGHTDSVKER